MADVEYKLLAAKVLLAALVLRLAAWLGSAFRRWQWQMQVKRKLEGQGFRVLPCTPVVGNAFDMAKIARAAYAAPVGPITHDILHLVSPPQWHWYKTLGPKFVYWMGGDPTIPVLDPTWLRDILFAGPEANGKSDSSRRMAADMVGDGLVLANGQQWQQQRQVVAPAFHAESLARMVVGMAETARQMVGKVDQAVAQAEAYEKPAEMDMEEYVTWAAADVIARTAFGGNYDIGQQVFAHLAEIKELSMTKFKYELIPGYKWLPVPANRRLWKLRKLMNSNLLRVINERRAQPIASDPKFPYGQDLLGLVILAQQGLLPRKGARIKYDNALLVDECKTFFVAGHETTSGLLTWALLLLAQNPEWQQAIREELVQVCGHSVPTTLEQLNRLKTLGMVINETLRMYSPAPNIVRSLFRDTKLGDVLIPAGVNLWIPLHFFHRLKEVWGEDANEFKPQRFSNGAANASKHPMGFVPFSNGPRNCVGANFAMMETKSVLVALLQRFSFKLSPNYKHAPQGIITLKPRFGMPLIVERYPQTSTQSA